LGDDPVIPGPRYEAACHDGLVCGHEGDSFAVGIVDDARLDEAPPVDGTRGTRTDPDAGSLRPDDVEVPDRRVLEHSVCRDGLQVPRTGNFRHTKSRLVRPGRDLSCRDSPDCGTESRRGEVLQHAPSRVLPLVVKSHPMHRGAVGGPATKVRLDTFVLRDPIARRNDRVGPKMTVRIGSRSPADSPRVRFEPASGRCFLPRPPFWLAERPRTPPRPCFGIDTCRSATATAVNEVGKSFLYSP